MLSSSTRKPGYFSMVSPIVPASSTAEPTMVARSPINSAAMPPTSAPIGVPAKKHIT